jgi:hypothetical protein
MTTELTMTLTAAITLANQDGDLNPRHYDSESDPAGLGQERLCWTDRNGTPRSIAIANPEDRCTNCGNRNRSCRC